MSSQEVSDEDEPEAARSSNADATPLPGRGRRERVAGRAAGEGSKLRQHCDPHPTLSQRKRVSWRMEEKHVSIFAGTFDQSDFVERHYGFRAVDYGDHC